MSATPNRALERRGVVFRNDASDSGSPTSLFQYECFICNNKIRSEKNAINHIDSPHHLQQINRFNKYFNIIPPANSLGRTSLSCKLCDLKPTWKEALNHVQKHNVIPWLKPDDLQRTFFRQFISEHQNSIYRCNLCNYTYGNWFHAMEHIKDAKHTKSWNLTSAPSASYVHYENTIAEFQVLISNRIFIGESKPYHCHMCNLSFKNTTEANNHVEGIEHKSLRMRFITEISEFKSKIPEAFEWVKKSIFMVVMRDKIYCKICDIYIVETTEIGPHMKTHKQNHVEAILKDNKTQGEQGDSDSDASVSIIHHQQGPNLSLSECELTIPNHLKWVITAHKVVIQKKSLYCTICKKTLNNNSAVASHFQKHLKPSWQDMNLPVGAPRNATSARLQELSGKASTSGQGSSTSGATGTLGTTKRNSVSPNNMEQTKIQKVDHYSGPKPPFKNVGNYIQILPQNSQPVKNPPSTTRAPLLSAPGTSGFTRFPGSGHQTSTNHPAAMVTNSKYGGPGLMGNRPQLLIPPFHRPNLIDLMKNIPSLMSQPVKVNPAANKNSLLSTPTDKVPLNNQPVNNHVKNQPANNHINIPPINSQPINNYSINLLINNPINQPLSQPNPVNNPFAKHQPPKQNPQQTLSLNNPLLNTTMMIKWHKANYLFFSKNEIYEMSPEKKRRIILSSQLSFFVKYTSDYFIYCVVCEKSIPYNLQNVYEHWCSSEHNDYLLKMEEDDRQFSVYPNQFSCLALSKEFMIENQSTGISSESDLKEFTCCTCDVTVQDQDSLLRQHFQSEDHQTNVRRFRRHSEEMCKDLFPLVESSWYSIEKYSCWPCQKILSNEMPYAEHLESKKHLSIVQAMSHEERKRYAFDSCAVCGILWFGNEDEYPKHCYQDAIHKELTRSIEDRVDYLPEEASSMCSFPDMNITELVEEADKVIQDRGRESELIRSLEVAVRRKFPDAKAYSFGSRITGLGLVNSDIDIFLDCGSSYNGQFSHPVDLIDRIYQCLKLDSQAWSVESVIENSRTPIIKVYHSHSQLKCDVSFTNGLSVENTKLLKNYLDAYPPCREMILFIKKWLSFCGLSGSRNITSYAISWFVIFFLQMRRILPSVASLMKGNPKPVTISGWPVGVRPFSVQRMSPPLTTKELLRGFFSFYADFDYRFNVACPLLGIVKTKKEFLYLALLPEEMKSYVELVSTEHDPEFFRIDSPMCIQDPYDLSHNLTKGVKKVIVNRFRKLCRKSAQILSGK